MNSRIEADEKISICIPTFERPQFLAEALESCISQDWRNFEILIGDDSRSPVNDLVVERFRSLWPGEIQHIRNTPSLGQSANVNALFDSARGSRLMLLHDDDVLMPGALKHLTACWKSAPSADLAFGKQVVIAHDGQYLPAKTADLNRRYRRTPENAGRQAIPAAVGLTRMLTSNGYLVRTSSARLGYKHENEVGTACDTDFAVRLCAAAKEIWFVDEFVMKYRLSKQGVSRVRANPAEAITYAILKQIDLPPEAKPFRAQAMREIAKFVVSDLARIGYRREAVAIMLSKDYSLADWLAPRCAYSIALLMHPMLARKAGPGALKGLAHR